LFLKNYCLNYDKILISYVCHQLFKNNHLRLMAVIAVNTRLLLRDKLEGIGVYSYEILKRVVKLNPQHQFIFLFDRPFSREFIFSENVKGVVINPPARHPLLWYLWFEWVVPYALKKHKADLFFSPDGHLSLRSDVRQIAVMHDLNFEHNHSYVPKHVYNYYHKYFPLFANKAEHILTVSEFSKQDIAKCYHISPQKISVTYNAAGEIFKPVNDAAATQIRNEFTNGGSFFMYAGALHQRKNIANMLKAYDAFRKKHSQPVKLLIAGAKMFTDTEMESTYGNMQFKEDVIFTGRLSTDNLAKTMAASIALLYISFFEGFGIPIVEAMNAGVPVITSNTSSMPEVAGDAALIVNPNSTAEIGDAMFQLATNNDLRKALIEKGNEQKILFSWDKSAAIVSAILNNSLR
jgi:glycosyltransferase involved in cell wall biosynthesis